LILHAGTNGGQGSGRREYAKGQHTLVRGYERSAAA
jgi:hypothetical protein